ncbi:MAG: flippase-like domain-containing protein [Saprospiraceae bacterium]|nr:flippase-like domain-containing protein [Saprospiraceae bacterium]
MSNSSQTEEKNPSTNTNIDENDGTAVLKSISPFRIALPIIIVLGVVGYMFYNEFDADEFSKINWSGNVILWILGAVVFMIGRHFFYMVRLRVITDGFFSWRKCFELIMMWEFSSAVTPTNVGGAAVAMFAITQEKLPGGRTTMLILYTVVVDTFFFLSALLLFFGIFGAIMIQPGCYDVGTLLSESALGTGFLIAYGVMFTYGSFFFYGVLVNAKGLQRLLLWFCKLSFLKRFEKSAIKVTEDMEEASKELRKKSWRFHLAAYGATAAAWLSRFMVLNCLVMAFVVGSETTFQNDVKDIQGNIIETVEVKAGEHYENLMYAELPAKTGYQLNVATQQVFIYARQQAMYVIMAVLPTPGGAGAAEYAFQQFHNDYIPTQGTLLTILTILWRFFTYYIYLFTGAIVVPNWVRKLINRRKEELQQEKLAAEQAGE